LRGEEGAPLGVYPEEGFGRSTRGEEIMKEVPPTLV